MKMVKDLVNYRPAVGAAIFNKDGLHLAWEKDMVKNGLFIGKCLRVVLIKVKHQSLL